MPSDVAVECLYARVVRDELNDQIPRRVRIRGWLQELISRINFSVPVAYAPRVEFMNPQPLGTKHVDRKRELITTDTTGH